MSFHLFAQAKPNLKSDPLTSFLDSEGIQGLKANVFVDKVKIAQLNYFLDNLSYSVEIISPILPEKAKAVINNNFFILLKAFEATPTPYVGQITRVQECEESSKPVISLIVVNGVEIKLISYLTDDSNKPGICLRNKNSKEVCQTFFYLTENQRLVKLKSISSKGEKCLVKIQKYLKKMKI
jgi:hypothetical protein